MKKLAGLMAAGALLLSTAVVFAKGPTAPAGKSNKAHLYLYEKDPGDWSIVEDGAWGKMTYDQSGDLFDYVFNGHGLVPENNYTLIYYPDPWPGTNLMCLGEGTANEEGDVHIAESYDTGGDLPTTDDSNFNWNVVGTYEWDVFGTYYHDITIDTQNPDGTFSGYGGYPAGHAPYDQPGQTTETITGQVSGNSFTMTTVYGGWSYSVTVNGTIANDGSISGTNPWGWWLTGHEAIPGGAKIWLVLSDDIICDDGMDGWNPTEYLFEYDLINFDYTP